MSEQELRRLLAEAVPEAATSGNRADAARAWARRRRNRVVAGASIAAVAVAIGIPVALAQGSDQRVEPAPEPKGFSCPPVQLQLSALPSADSTPGRLSEGAIAVRLCNQYDGVGLQVPVDALMGKAAGELATSIGSLRPQKDPASCNLMFAPTYFFVFSYPDGHTERVAAQAGTCPGGVSVGSGQARGSGQDAAAILKQFTTALLAQRAGQKPPSRAETKVSCARGNEVDARTSPLDQGEVPDLSSAVLCWDGNLFSQQPTQEERFDPQDLRLLLDSMRSETDQGRSFARDCGPGSINYRIVGETAWGDRYALYGDCGGFELGAGDAFRVWRPEGEAAAILAKMVATGTDRLELPTSVDSADEVLLTWADLVNAGDARADALWVHGQPSDIADARPVFISPGKGDVLPNGQRDISVPGYAQAVETDAIWADSTICPDNRAKIFVLVRQSDFEPWRILSWTDHGAFQHGSTGC